MTLQNGLIHQGKAYLWTDTAHWNGETGELLCHDSKAFTVLTWPAAFVLSCQGGNMHELGREIGRALPASEAELLLATSKALQAYCEAGGSGRVLIATANREPHLFMIASDGAGAGEPFEALALAQYTSSGNRSKAYRRALKGGITPSAMAGVIDSQIAEPFQAEGPLSGLGKRVWIGGNIVEFEVSPDGVESRILRAVN